MRWFMTLTRASDRMKPATKYKEILSAFWMPRVLFPLMPFTDLSSLPSSLSSLLLLSSDRKLDREQKLRTEKIGNKQTDREKGG